MELPWEWSRVKVKGGRARSALLLILKHGSLQAQVRLPPELSSWGGDEDPAADPARHVPVTPRLTWAGT